MDSVAATKELPAFRNLLLRGQLDAESLHLIAPCVFSFCEHAGVLFDAL